MCMILCNMSPIDKAIEITGGLSELARLIGVSPNQLGNWRSRRVPAEHCPSFERVTKGVVRCEELRPDVDWSVLRCNKKSVPSKAPVRQ